MAVPPSRLSSDLRTRLTSALDELDSTLREVHEQEARWRHLRQQWRQKWDLQDSLIAEQLQVLDTKLREIAPPSLDRFSPQLKVLC
jgi:hypothetical protein